MKGQDDVEGFDSQLVIYDVVQDRSENNNLLNNLCKNFN